MMSVSETYTTNNDGSDVPEDDYGMMPYQIEFESQYQFPDIKTETPWHEQLTSITADDDQALLDVYALTAPLQLGGERVRGAVLPSQDQLAIPVQVIRASLWSILTWKLSLSLVDTKHVTYYLLSLEREDVDTEQARVHDFYYKTMFIEKFGKISTIVFWLRQEP